jgi:hypothetical protein
VNRLRVRYGVTAAAAAATLLAGCATANGWRPAEPDTAAGARAAAGRLLGYYAAGQFGQAWAMLEPATQEQVPRATWTGFYDQCSAVTGVRYHISDAVLSGEYGAKVVAVVAVSTRADALPPGYPLTLSFGYDGTRWRYQPNSTAIWTHGSVAADLAAARAAGVC